MKSRKRLSRERRALIRRTGKFWGANSFLAADAPETRAIEKILAGLVADGLDRAELTGALFLAAASVTTAAVRPGAVKALEMREAAIVKVEDAAVLLRRVLKDFHTLTTAFSALGVDPYASAAVVIQQYQLVERILALAKADPARAVPISAAKQRHGRPASARKQSMDDLVALGVPKPKRIRLLQLLAKVYRRPGETQ